jgi:hypothetical protein
MIKHILGLILLFMSTEAIAAQDSVIIPINRIRFHDRIKDEQIRADKADGRLDGFIKVCGNEAINLQVTDALTRRIKLLQDFVETNPQIISNNEKIRSLGYIEDVVKLFRIGWKDKSFNAMHAPQLIDNFEQILKANIDSIDMCPFLAEVPYDVGSINATIFNKNKGYAESKKILFLKYVADNPDKILINIRDYVNESFADSLMVVAAQNNPKLLYDYASAANSPEGKLIRKSSDPLVSTIAKLSETPNALLYFPFLDNIISGKQSVDSIRKLVGDGELGYDSVGYFKLLVKTEIEYYDRLIRQDTPYAMLGSNGLRDMMQRKAIKHFITPINELHNQSNLNIRMKALDPLSAEELYYAMVLGENDIYTSSYKHSFNRLMQRMGAKPKGDHLLMNVNMDYFKKFIKMAANFNQLDSFLKTMPAVNATTLMRAFVANLDQVGSLEEAVDVADSYSSIKNKDLLETIFQYVVENEDRSIEEDNKRGKIIYSLLKTIFRSADNNLIDLTDEIGIPSIYRVENNYLADDSGRIIHQVFFYGDEDGKLYFTPFVNSFPAADWKIKWEKEWVEIKSLKGKKVWIYANRPLDSDQNLDDSAQVHLNKYLLQNDLYPSVVTHRGHSYWLNGTIKRMPGSAKIIVLGSCGGYKNLSEILNICPDAHIISTKEIGKGDINRPILNYLNQNFMSGNAIVWKDMWAILGKGFHADPNKEVGESWDDYIPPYRNLGAIFLKAYNKKMESE